jgi:hypothetical protein
VKRLFDELTDVNKPQASEPTPVPTSPKTAVSEDTKNLNTVWSITDRAANGSALLLSFVFGAVGQRYAAIGALVLTATWFTCSWLFRRSSSAAREACDLLRQPRNISTDERQVVRDHIIRADKRLKLCLIGFSLLSVGLLAVIAASPGSRLLRTREPVSLKVERASRYTPSGDRDLFTDAHFMTAVIGDLETEGKEAKQEFQIVILTSEPLKHPAPAFRLKVGYEPQSYGIAGYAFRVPSQGGRLIEAVPISYTTDGMLRLGVPPAEEGDRVLIVARIWLYGAKQFPGPDLAARTLMLPDPGEEPR